MWIRSQDKETLIKCENIYCAGTLVCCGEGVILGEYSSKEKVLKVLDMIEAHLIGFPVNKCTQIVRDCNLAGLEKTLNKIGYENVLQVMPCYCGMGEYFYTIIYREKENVD